MERKTGTGASISRMLLAIVVAVSGCGLDSGLHGVAVKPPREMPTFEFTRADGSVYRTAADAERPMVLFFGYTHCPDVCPTTLMDWKRVKQELGRDSSRVRFVFVTIDPERDTREVADKYAKQFDPSFVGLSGDSLTTARMQEAFGVASIRESTTSAAGDLMSHSSQVFLVDPRGRLVVLHAFGTGWDALLADLRQLL